MKIFKQFLLAIYFLAGGSVAIGQDVQLTNNSTYGEILTDANGMTLYYFTKDSEPNESSCPDGCATIWPVFYEANITVATGLDLADFDEFQRADNTMQTTYKGWPLYYYYTDSNAGDVNGEDNLNHWYVAKADYSIMLMNNELQGLDGNFYNNDYTPGTQEEQYFTDAYGRTLYTWVNDHYDVNNFTADDFSNNGIWPVYEEELQSIPSVLNASDFSTIDVNGHTQLTYKGWPLYYFGQDSQKGETLGVSVPSPGIWPVAVEEMAPASGTAVYEIEEAISINVGPNPFSNKIQMEIKTLNTAFLTVDLYNGLGQKIKTLYVGNLNRGNNTMTFDINSALESGVYFVKIFDGKKTIISKKLVKK